MGHSHCLPVTVTFHDTPYIHGGPVYDSLSDNTRVLASLVSSPHWIAEWGSNNPAFSCDGYRSVRAEIISVSSISAPLQKVNQPFHHFSDESVDLINATCLGHGQQQYIIKLSNDASPPASGDLAVVEPGKATTTLRATVYDSSNQPAPNINVKLEVTVEANTGGHQHNDNRPKGLLNNGVSAGIVIEGNTGSGGMPFTFRAPAPAGDHKIIATCTGGKTCTQQGPDRVGVGVKDLAPLSGVSGAYRLVGGDSVHPGNSYLASQASPVISNIAGLYKIVTQFDAPPTPVLHLNDASLERGGLFDIQYPGRGTTWWTAPHSTHRFGVEIDVRANPKVNPGTAIPEANFGDFEFVVARFNATRCPPGPGPGYLRTDNQHYHVCLMGGNCCQGGNR